MRVTSDPETEQPTSDNPDDGPRDPFLRQRAEHLLIDNAGGRANDWLSSPERRGYRRAVPIVVIFAVVTVIVIWLTSTLPSNGAPYWSAGKADRFLADQVGLISLLVTAVIAFFLLRSIRRGAEKAFDTRRNVERMRLTLEQMQPEGVKLDIESLWSVTHKRLDLYHQIATDQVEKSYRHSQRATIAGFCTLTAAVIFSAISSSLGGALAAGIVGVAGSALAGYLSRTFLRIHQSSTQQLRSYFEQPLLFSQQLAAERLVRTLDPPDRAEAVKEIIRGISGHARDGGPE